jgi:carbonic anhydrase
MAAKSSFCTAINCMDGRTQVPVVAYLKKRFRVRYVDMITEPGPCRVLAERRDKNLLASIIRRIRISVEKHGSKVIAVTAHHDCAGNPVSKTRQLRQLNRNIFLVKLVKFYINHVIP